MVRRCALIQFEAEFCRLVDSEKFSQKKRKIRPFFEAKIFRFLEKNPLGSDKKDSGKISPRVLVTVVVKMGINGVLPKVVPCTKILVLTSIKSTYPATLLNEVNHETD